MQTRNNMMGPETARHLARYTMSAARLAPDVYNPASAMDQVLESISPGLSKTVTTRAGAMMLKGVHPKTALEQSLAESFVALAPKYPKAPAMGGLGTTTTTTTETTRYTGRAATLHSAGSLIDAVGGAVSGLISGITELTVGVQTQRRADAQQSFEQRMAQANADRRAAEDAAIQEAGGLPRMASAGGIGMGTILLGALGLATAGGAIYFITKKK